MNTEDIREKHTDELQNLENDLRRELWKAKIENHAKQLSDTARLKKLRRDIARVKTVLHERTQQKQAAS